MSAITRFIAAMSAVLLIGAFVSTAPYSSVEAQDATVDQIGGHPVAIHVGTCDNPTAEPAQDLGEAHLPGIDDDDDDGDVRGSAGAVPVLVSEETVGLSFDNVFDDDQHLIAVHLSAEEFGTIVACGEIGGLVQDGRLVMGLETVDDSGVSGVVVIDEDASGFLGLGDDELNIKVYLLSEASTAGAPVDPDASPTVVNGAGDEDDAVDDAEETVEGAVDEAEETVDDAVDDVTDEDGSPESED